MKIVVTGGGTAGHVTPLLAVASEIKLQQPDAHIRYVGKYGDSIGKSVNEHGAIEKDYKIFAGKLRRFYGKPWYWYFTQPALVLHNIKDGLLFAIGFLQALYVLVVWRPHAVFVKGGYVGLPVGLAAAALRIPIVTHDSDVLPGLTNRILSRYAKALAVGSPVDQYPQYAHKNVHFTGVPVREDFLHPPTVSQARSQLKLPEKSRVVAVIGGSLGAVRVNTAILNILDELIGADEDRQLYWLTGAQSYEYVKNTIKIKDYAERTHVAAYSHDLPAIFAAADIIVTRAGATTLAELAVMKKPIIVIPNPLLTGGHQTKNAQMLKDARAAIVISEDTLSAEPLELSNAIDDLLSDSKMRMQLAENFSQLSAPTAAQDIAKLVLLTAKK